MVEFVARYQHIVQWEIFSVNRLIKRQKKQVNVLNQSLYKLNHTMVKPLLIAIVIIFNDVTNKSREQRLITKECIEFNSSALYFST